jgi:hypothetical protein
MSRSEQIINIKTKFICWISKYIQDIHTEKEGINRIPDIYSEYKCKYCGKIYKL